MAELTVNEMDVAGVDPESLLVSAEVGGDSFANRNDRRFVFVRNGDDSAHTVTIKDRGSRQPEGATEWNPDVQVEVPDGEDRLIGPFKTKRFNNDVGHVELEYDAVTSVEVAVFEAVDVT